MKIQPYLFFDGRCDEALAFYREALGAEVEMLMRFKDGPQPSCGSGAQADKVMHAQFRIGETLVMASDGRCEGQTAFKGFSLSLDPRDEAAANRIFNALAAGGQVQMPLTKTFYSPCFGMVADKFGVSWMVCVGK